MKQLWLVLATFIASLLVVAAILFQRAHQAVVAQEQAELGFFANEILERMDAELATLAREEASRDMRDYLPRSDTSARDRRDPPYVLGRMACRADGGFTTPAVRARPPGSVCGGVPGYGRPRRGELRARRTKDNARQHINPPSPSATSPSPNYGR